MPRKVVIDTDFGTDAAAAIAVALAMASDEIEVQAFTVVGRQSIYRKTMLEEFLSSLGDNCAIPAVYAGGVDRVGSSFPSAGFLALSSKDQRTLLTRHANSFNCISTCSRAASSCAR